MSIKIKELLFSAEVGVTIAVASDGINYALPALRDPVLVAKWCRMVREGKWELACSPEGMEILMKAPDLTRQAMSF